MAFDQVSIFLYPPRWQRKTTREGAATDPGSVAVVSDCREPNCVGPVITVEECGRWLESRGLADHTMDPRYPIYYGEHIPSAMGDRPNVEISISRHEAEVASLYCRFLLTRDAPGRLDEWQGLMRGLGEAFGFRIFMADGVAVSTGELLSVIRRSEAWACFATELGWAE